MVAGNMRWAALATFNAGQLLVFAVKRLNLRTPGPHLCVAGVQF
jgi:hypothetical protein